MRTNLSIKFVAVIAAVLLLVPDAGAHDPVYAKKGMVVAQEPLAVDVGVSVLKSGGNAVDAAIAVGFALAVTFPYAGNLGGGGFMLVRMADGRTSFFDFREKAPLKATHDMYLDASGKLTRDSLVGWRASGVPGTVRGLELAHQKYSTQKWADLIRPAVELADKGFPVSRSMMDSLRASSHYGLSDFPETKRIFLKDGNFYEWNEMLRQPELARTLERIAKEGSKDFYEGETAHILASEMEKNGGLITLQDLREYQAIERKPLEGDYRGYHIITSPPPSSGGIGILQMLQMLEGTGYDKSGAGSANTYHYLAEVMRRFYADRNEYLGDSDFVKDPIALLLDPAYVRKRRESIDSTLATASDSINPGLPAGKESSDTTHYTIADEQGNVVAVTYTLNAGYGSGVTVPGVGFLLNDEMDDFASKPGSPNLFGLVQGEANSIAPGKRPLSSMVPTIVLKDGKPFLALGAPGGSRIITAVMQVMLNVMDFGMNVQDAIDFPRVHHQWKPDRLEFERGISPDTIALLKKAGYHIEESKPAVLARVEGILIHDGWMQGGHDERGAGKAAGY